MKGTVYKSTGSWYLVKAEDNLFYTCRLKGKFRIKGIKSTNPVAVGDHVQFSTEKSGHETIGVINAIENRKNYIIRKSVNLSKQTHIIAANIDLAFLIVTVNTPPTSTTFIDRFLVTTEAYHIPSVLLFNKIDLYTKQELEEVAYLKALYTSIGYKCVEISTKTRLNIDLLKQLMKGKVSVFSGHSGVGKSSLINVLEPSLNLKTKEISSQHQKGQHTTTFAQMYDLSFGATIIDTPGIRGLGMVAMEKEEITDYFPEIFKLKQNCKYNNCLHLNEPKCAVKKALEKNEIAWSRYNSYLQLLEDDDENYRKDIYNEL